MDFSYLDDWTEEESQDIIEEAGEGYRNIWVLAETEDGALLPASLEAMGQARELADQIGCYVYGLLLGQGAEEAPGQELIAYGADKVLLATSPALSGYQPQAYVQAIAQLVADYRPEILLLSATPFGNDLAPRLAHDLNTGLLSHCIKLGLDMAERILMGTFPVLGAEIYHTATCPTARPQMASLEPGHFRPPFKDTYRSGEVQTVALDLDGLTAALTWTDLQAAVELPAVPLNKARVVVSAGRGLGDADGFALVEKLAAALGGTVAGSRGAFDEGWIAEEQIVGVGGASITPDLYIACGVAGDVYHYFGVQDSKYVVAINSDESAPIVKAANMALIGDARQIIPALLEALEN